MNFLRALWMLGLLALVGGVNAQGLQGPQILRGPDPVYRPEALAAVPKGGTINLYVEIDCTGKVTDIEAFGPALTCGTSDPFLDELRDAAVYAAKRTVFEPASRDGVAIDGVLLMSYKIEPQKTPKIDEAPAPQPQPEPGKKLVGGVVNGRAILLPKPKLPAKVRKFKLSEQVTVQVFIDEQGNVTSVSANSGHPLLLAASAQAACQAKFTPTLLSGHPVKVSGAIIYNFVP